MIYKLFCYYPVLLFFWMSTYYVESYILSFFYSLNFWKQKNSHINSNIVTIPGNSIFVLSFIYVLVVRQYIYTKYKLMLQVPKKTIQTVNNGIRYYKSCLMFDLNYVPCYLGFKILNITYIFFLIMHKLIWFCL